MENYSESAEKNRQPILDKLKYHFHQATSVLEIGSGSGQHAVFFTTHLTQLIWQATETAENLPALQNNLLQQKSLQLPPPLLLDVQNRHWPLYRAENIFTANTLHIMPLAVVEKMFSGIGSILNQRGLLCVYGAMRYNGGFTSDSNARFDHRLKQQNPARGIRDFETIDLLAKEQELELMADHDMPSNNQLLVWRRRKG
jgi:hypothetical protein